MRPAPVTSLPARHSYAPTPATTATGTGKPSNIKTVSYALALSALCR